MAVDRDQDQSSDLERPRSKQDEARDRVLELIEGLEVGDAIPAERRLGLDFGMSRLTVRAALDELVREGRLVRRHGSGTFVSEPKIAQHLTLTSFTDDMRRRGMRPSSRTLELTLTTAGAHLGRCLHLSPADRIVRARRLRLADTESMAIETLHVPEALVPGLAWSDLETGSFYDLLEHRYGIVMASGIQTIEPTVTSEEESQALGVPLHSPAFLFERTSRDEEGRIVEYVRSVYRGDRYRIVAELSLRRTRDGRGAGDGAPVITLGHKR
jgi:GntR family transcriptional regulator